ncbi:hypothetical protein ACJDU8_04455 [Clostridium sp. WILCCON 0269]|uniref:C2H2-type domain-containing protein n=1 Tax=Candidatus Clostridium eludens TaxID=3381663 RepID=A0ABW8SFK9_9CLOT
MKNSNKIKKLIKDKCACYFTQQGSINNYCCNIDGSCLFFCDNEESTGCRYFEEGVLPIEAELEFEYRNERHMDGVDKIKAKPRVRCERCGDSFSANSNRQHFCAKCKKINDREKAKLRMKKLREKRHNVTI